MRARVQAAEEEVRDPLAPNSPGGSEMLWITRSSTTASSGRASWCGEGIHRAPEHMPAMSTRKRGGATGLSISMLRREFRSWRDEVCPVPTRVGPV